MVVDDGFGALAHDEAEKDDGEQAGRGGLWRVYTGLSEVTLL